ncbi:phosphotransferase, partial [Rhodobacterales bacterium HKCCSP123]|nr:phosphotransferase [Rhodobacterales bacterium HKCCSP123]
PAIAALPALMAEALARHAGGPPVLALRDYHADNLIWLPAREGPARIGLLDVQDAVALPLGYDLASLLDDPRRDVPETVRSALTRWFAATQGLDPGAAAARLATLSLLRNLRILGIFRRLSTEGGKPRYAAFLPRTGRLVDRAAAHPALAALHAPVARLRALSAHWPEAAA